MPDGRHIRRSADSEAKVQHSAHATHNVRTQSRGGEFATELLLIQPFTNAKGLRLWSARFPRMKQTSFRLSRDPEHSEIVLDGSSASDGGSGSHQLSSNLVNVTRFMKCGLDMRRASNQSSNYLVSGVG